MVWYQRNISGVSIIVLLFVFNFILCGLTEEEVPNGKFLSSIYYAATPKVSMLRYLIIVLPYFPY